MPVNVQRQGERPNLHDRDPVVSQREGMRWMNDATEHTFLTMKLMLRSKRCDDDVNRAIAMRQDGRHLTGRK